MSFLPFTCGFCSATFASRRARAGHEGYHSRPRRSAPDRFWKLVYKTPTCWLWLGAKSAKGYGRFGVLDKRAVLAHRFAYELLVGPIPTGLPLDHLCKVRACVNPAHLEPVTTAENNRRSPRVLPTHCPHGHAYSAANTYVYRGARYCRTCHRQRQATRLLETAA